MFKYLKRCVLALSLFLLIMPITAKAASYSSSPYTTTNNFNASWEVPFVFVVKPDPSMNVYVAARPGYAHILGQDYIRQVTGAPAGLSVAGQVQNKGGQSKFTSWVPANFVSGRASVSHNGNVSYHYGWVKEL